jgi:endonuclease/exonuclease/phosphatase family metal-dependent hydrolase
MRLLLALALSAAGLGCSIEPNYLDPDGPCYFDDLPVMEPEPGGPLRVVSYNLAFGREVETAVGALKTGPLAGADLVLMQEMDRPGVDQIARALDLHYVYCPASKKHGQDWGNAVLSRRPLIDHHKLRLPYADPFSDSRRIAVAAHIDVGGHAVLAYSTHIATPSLGLGARLEQMETIIDDADEEGDASVLIGGDLNTADPGSGGQVRDLFAGRDFDWASSHATDTGSAFGRDATLDYVFTRGLEAQDSGTFAGDSGSDHQPIWVELAPP